MFIENFQDIKFKYVTQYQLLTTIIYHHFSSDLLSSTFC